MAEKKPSKNKALAMLTPNAIKTSINGEEIVVAGNKGENDVLNMVVAAQMRNMLQENIKRYKESGQTLTPKELKELAEAARNIAEFSGEIYKGAESLDERSTENSKEPGEKKVEGTLSDISFDKIKPIEVKTNDAGGG